MGSFYLLPAPDLMRLESVIDCHAPKESHSPAALRSSPVRINEVTFPLGVARKGMSSPGQ